MSLEFLLLVSLLTHFICEHLFKKATVTLLWSCHWILFKLFTNGINLKEFICYQTERRA